jgi:cytochrome c-type biogenesis protein CcmH
MRRVLYLLPLAAFLAMAAWFAIGLTKDPSKLPSALLDRPAPEFMLPALPGSDAPALSSATLQGKVSLVNVFASWCVPCRAEHPILMRLAGETGVPVYGISYKDKADDSLRFLRDARQSVPGHRPRRERPCGHRVGRLRRARDFRRRPHWPYPSQACRTDHAQGPAGDLAAADRGTRPMRRLLFLVALIVLTAPALAVLPDEMLPDPALEARARLLSREIRCQVCQNQSIDDSAAPLAADLRRLVRERLVAGDTDEAVFSFLTRRYGDNVLMRPPVRPATWPLWFGPLAILVIAAVGLLTFLRRRRTVFPTAIPLAPAEERRLAELLRQDRR